MRIYHHYSLYGFSNVYLVGNDDSKQAFVVDPAEMNAALLGHIEKNGYDLTAVFITHNHPHHVRGLKTLLKIYDATVYAANASIAGFPCKALRDGESVAAGGYAVEVYSVPGHSPDSLVFKVNGILFTGDAIHAGLIGKTLSSYNAVTLADSLKSKILDQPDEYVILPGHGPPSTVGTERSFNVGLEPGYAERITSRYDFFV